MKGKCGLLRLESTGQVIVPRLWIAESLLQRSIGLLGQSNLEEDEGLLLSPCGGIHTLFMRFSLDILFLDRSGHIVRIVPSLRPWRFCGPVFEAHSVVELPAGSLSHRKLKTGMICRIEPRPTSPA